MLLAGFLGACGTNGLSASDLTPSDHSSCHVPALQHVHDPGRLDMLAACASFIGTVSSIRFDSSFDDLKLIVVPDAPFLRYLRPANEGHVVVDVIATDLDTVHAVPQGTHAIFFGAWVLNRANGQVEMLPTFKITAPNLDPRKVVAVPQLTAGLDAHRSQKLDIRAVAPADVAQGKLLTVSVAANWLAARVRQPASQARLFAELTDANGNGVQWRAVQTNTLGQATVRLVALTPPGKYVVTIYGYSAGKSASTSAKVTITGA